MPLRLQPEECDCAVWVPWLGVRGRVRARVRLRGVGALVRGQG